MCVYSHTYLRKKPIFWPFPATRESFFYFPKKRESYIIFFYLLLAFIKWRSTLQRHSFASLRESESRVAVIIFHVFFFFDEFLPSCDERTQVDSSRRDQTRKNFIGTNPAIFWGQRHTKQDVRNEPKMGIKISYVGLCWLMLLSTFVSIRITQ